VSKSIIILGAGESGVGAAKLALSRGYVPFEWNWQKAKVCVYKQNNNLADTKFVLLPTDENGNAPPVYVDGKVKYSYENCMFEVEYFV